jgi:hypothetical protein
MMILRGLYAAPDRSSASKSASGRYLSRRRGDAGFVDCVAVAELPLDDDRDAVRAAFADRSQHLAQRLRVQRPGKLPAVDGDRERRPTVPVRPESGQRRELLRVEDDRDLDRPGG